MEAVLSLVFSARYKEYRRSLEDVRGNFLTQVLDRLRDDVQMDLLFADKEELIRDRINNGSICYAGCEIVKLKILR